MLVPRVFLFCSVAIVASFSSQEIADCRVHNHLYVCFVANFTLEAVAFEDANAVQTIDDVELHLENLGIFDIAEKTFNETSNATSLYLSDNKLTAVRRHYFSYLDQLMYLDLKNSLISEIEDGAFAKLSNLETLLLDCNFITKLSPGVWKGLAYLRELYLTNNTVSLKKNMFRGLKQLETLALDSNELEEIPVGTFNGLNYIDLLYLSRNNFAALHPDVFRGLNEVNELDLGKNHINNIPTGIFRNMKSLESLWLNGNRIESLQAGAFEGLNRISSLFLSDNELRTVDFATFRLLRKTNIEPGFVINGSYVQEFSVIGTFRCTGVFKGYRQEESPKPHPCYRSTSMDYGWYSPTVHTVPTVFYPRTTAFSNELGRAGMYRNRSLNTELDKVLF